MPNFNLEESVRSKAGNPDLFVAGIDEVGMGPLAGPVMAAAVVLGKPQDWFSCLDDSKRLTRNNRDRLVELIVGNAAALGIGYSSNDMIDELGITEARNMAAIDAFEQCLLSLEPFPVAAVVDDSNSGYPCRSGCQKDSVAGQRAEYQATGAERAGAVGHTEE